MRNESGREREREKKKKKEKKRKEKKKRARSERKKIISRNAAKTGYSGSGARSIQDKSGRWGIVGGLERTREVDRRSLSIPCRPPYHGRLVGSSIRPVVMVEPYSKVVVHESIVLQSSRHDLHVAAVAVAVVVVVAPSQSLGSWSWSMLPLAVNALLGSDLLRCQNRRLENIDLEVVVGHSSHQDGLEDHAQGVHNDHQRFPAGGVVHEGKGIHVQKSEKMLVEGTGMRDGRCFCRVVVHEDCDLVLPWARLFHWYPTWTREMMLWLLVGGRVGW